MKVINLQGIETNELTRISHLFIGMNYRNCDKELSFVYKDDENNICGFALLRVNKIDLTSHFPELIDIDEDMVGCEILQIYADSVRIEHQLLKRVFDRIHTWLNYENHPFDYFWSELLTNNVDFYSIMLHCNKIQMLSRDGQIKQIIYNKISV